MYSIFDQFWLRNTCTEWTHNKKRTVLAVYNDPLHSIGPISDMHCVEIHICMHIPLIVYATNNYFVPGRKIFIMNDALSFFSRVVIGNQKFESGFEFESESTNFFLNPNPDSAFQGLNPNPNPAKNVLNPDSNPNPDSDSHITGTDGGAV